MPIQIKANNVPEIQYTDTLSPQNTLYFTDSDAFETAWARALAAEQITPSAHHVPSLSCVAYAKQYLGVGGIWGAGGRNLSLNSDGEIGDVVIFRFIHVAVITARVGSILTITEANYDWHGSIRTRTLDAADSSILGFHSF